MISRSEIEVPWSRVGVNGVVMWSGRHGQWQQQQRCTQWRCGHQSNVLGFLDMVNGGVFRGDIWSIVVVVRGD